MRSLPTVVVSGSGEAGGWEYLIIEDNANGVVKGHITDAAGEVLEDADDIHAGQVQRSHGQQREDSYPQSQYRGDGDFATATAQKLRRGAGHDSVGEGGEDGDGPRAGAVGEGVGGVAGQAARVAPDRAARGVDLHHAEAVAVGPRVLRDGREHGPQLLARQQPTGEQGGLEALPVAGRGRHAARRPRRADVDAGDVHVVVVLGAREPEAGRGGVGCVPGRDWKCPCRVAYSCWGWSCGTPKTERF